MDDGPRLSEWIAFHYHVLKLRNLIVMVDPRSVSSPTEILDRWNGLIKIEQWSDSDVFTDAELFDRSENNLVQLHRQRQRRFNIQCMKRLRQGGASWTVMTDTDEYTFINPRARRTTDSLFIPGIKPPPISEAGSVLHFLRKLDLPNNHFHLETPCLPLPRLQIGGIESSLEEVSAGFPTTLADSFSPTDFDTFRWRHYGTDSVTGRNGTIAGKTLIDLSRITTEEEALFSGDPHRPIEKLCVPSKVWLNESESLFVAAHVLGSIEQFARRMDARFIFRAMSYEARKNIGGSVTDEARQWLRGFVDSVGVGEAKRLLQGIGEKSSQATKTERNTPDCSINFFGLPRSFKTMVLPSVIQNILIPNAKYGCDVFVHYYDINFETPGRFNRGGITNASSIESLKSAVEVVSAHFAHSKPNVVFVKEKKEDFWRKYGTRVQHYQSQTNKDGTLKYFPWKDQSYSSVKQLENIVMQWNSIQSVWYLMEENKMKLGKNYERVAFFRSDVLFATPIDIFQVDFETPDHNNTYAVIPGFAKHPVNDRMIYGPYEAVKIWATNRLDLLESHVMASDMKGYGMHSEKFMDYTILPAITNWTGIPVVENMDICFYRVRPGDSMIISDCDDRDGGSTRGIKAIDEQVRVEMLIDRLCQRHDIPGVRFQELRCDGEVTQVEAVHRQLATPTAAPTPPPRRKKRGKKKSPKPKPKKATKQIIV